MENFTPLLFGYVYGRRVFLARNKCNSHFFFFFLIRDSSVIFVRAFWKITPVNGNEEGIERRKKFSSGLNYSYFILCRVL